MLPIGNRAYITFGDLMSWSGQGFEGIGREVIPVQDMNASLLNQFVKRTLYTFNIATVNGVVATLLQWNDASDWTEVQVNGEVQVADSALPQDSDERIIVSVGLEISGVTPAEYADSAQITRRAPVVLLNQTAVREWGTLASASILCPQVIGTNVLPQTLNINEATVEIRIIGTGTAATGEFTVEMISAERGVMRPFPGV